MYIFNPDNDLALANFNQHFTAPASARKIRGDLELLPLWYAPTDAAIITDSDKSPSFLEHLKSLFPFNNTLVSLKQLGNYATISIKPWGWNPALRKQMIESGVDEQVLPSMSGMALLRDYSNRQNAVKLLRELKLIDDQFCGASNYFASIEHLLHYLNYTKENQLLKIPLSGSGKGLMWIKGKITDKQIDWCRRVSKMQGGVVVEPVLDKILDFAMEFNIVDEGIHFAGYSLFESAASGAYMGNMLMSDAAIENRLAGYVDRKSLIDLKSLLKDKLREYFPHYRGYLGVDMMICDNSQFGYQIHPCVEINLRMNMGMVAHRIYERFVHPSVRGEFSINFFKQEDEAQSYILSMEAEYPLVIENNKIKGGFLALTPVDNQTQYVATVVIKQNHEKVQ